jgi:hypothetical protein
MLGQSGRGEVVHVHAQEDEDVHAHEDEHVHEDERVG